MNNILLKIIIILFITNLILSNDSDTFEVRKKAIPEKTNDKFVNFGK